ncbi:carbonic anhydrase [Stipitochalara longipes BDJ]|nr:carbonic anhydrase [Stipitochalara longipes BDJ]
MFSFIIGLGYFAAATACPQHEINQHSNTLNKRAGGTQDWTYEASYNWDMIAPNYTLCQTGTQQSPIMLMITQGLSQNHAPSFTAGYTSPASGTLYNWGYGPAFTTNSTSITSAPSMTYDNETLYLKGWHIHSPADHTVQSERSKAELHLVHADSTGAERGVVAIRIDSGNSDSTFFSQFLSSETSIDMLQALKEINMFNEFWTYEGSLTSPPCAEGIRWWVARNTLFVGVQQMQRILGVSKYSARVEQEVWMDGINV